MSCIKAPQQETFYDLLRDPDGRKHQKYYIRKAGPTKSSQTLVDLSKQDRLLSHRAANNVLPFHETERDQHFSVKNEKRGQLDVMYEVASSAKKMEPYSSQRAPSLRLFSGRPESKPKDMRLLDIHVYNVNHDMSSREPHSKNAVFGTEGRLPRLRTATEVSAQSYSPVVTHIAHIGRDPSATMKGPDRSCFEVDSLTSDMDYNPNYEYMADRTEGFNMEKMLSRKDAFNPIQRDSGTEFGKREKVIPLHMLRRKKAKANSRSEYSMKSQESSGMPKKTKKKPKTWRDEIPSQLSGYLEKADDLYAQRTGTDRISTDVQYAIVRVKRQPDRVLFRGADRTVADRISMRIRHKWAVATGGGFDPAYNMINCIAKDLCENREFFTFCNREYGRLFTFFAPDIPCMSEYNAQAFLDGFVALASYIPNHKPVFNACDREKTLNTKYLLRCLSNEDILNKIGIMNTFMNNLYLPLTLRLKACNGQTRDQYNIYREYLTRTTEYLEKPFLLFQASITDPRLRSLQATALCAAVEILQEMVITHRHVDLTAEFISFEQEGPSDTLQNGEYESDISNSVKPEHQALSLEPTNWADATKEGYKIQGITPGLRPGDSPSSERNHVVETTSCIGTDDDFSHSKRARRSEPISLDECKSSGDEGDFEEYAAVFRKRENEKKLARDEADSERKHDNSSLAKDDCNNQMHPQHAVSESTDKNIPATSEESERHEPDDTNFNADTATVQRKRHDEGITNQTNEGGLHQRTGEQPLEVNKEMGKEKGSHDDAVVGGQDNRPQGAVEATEREASTEEAMEKGSHSEEAVVVGDADDDALESQDAVVATEKPKSISMFSRTLSGEPWTPSVRERALSTGGVIEARSTDRRNSEPSNFEGLTAFMEGKRKQSANFIPPALVKEKAKSQFEQEQEDFMAQLLSGAKVGDVDGVASQEVMEKMWIRDTAASIAKKAVLHAKLRMEDNELELIRAKKQEALKKMTITPEELQVREDMQRNSHQKNALVGVMSNPLRWLDQEVQHTGSPLLDADGRDLVPNILDLSEGMSDDRSQHLRSSIEHSASNESIGEQMLEELDNMLDHEQDHNENERLQDLIASAAALTGDTERPTDGYLEKRRKSLRPSSGDDEGLLPHPKHPPKKLFSASAASADGHQGDIQKMAAAIKGEH